MRSQRVKHVTGRSWGRPRSMDAMLNEQIATLRDLPGLKPIALGGS